MACNRDERLITALLDIAVITRSSERASCSPELYAQLRRSRFFSVMKTIYRMVVRHYLYCRNRTRLVVAEFKLKLSLA